MRILIITTGSVGEVAPYTGLAAHLVASGHETSIATLERFGPLVRERGLQFRSLGTDLSAMLGPADGQDDGQAFGKRPWTLARDLKTATSMVEDLGHGMAEAVRQGADVVLLSAQATPLGWHVTEGLGVRSLGVYLYPSHPTCELPPINVPVSSLGPRANKAAARTVLEVRDALTSLLGRDLWRRPEFLSTSSRALRRRLEAQGWPVCYGFSSAVVPRPADWRTGLEVVGYWWPARPLGWQPPADLVDFLDAGPPPVFVGFGSSGRSEGERLSEVTRSALRRAGVRGVVQSGWAGLSVADDDVFTVDEVPYGWLMPRVAAAVHHAGAGTAAAALRAGVPSLPVPPMGFDNPFWARRLVALGVGPDQLAFKDLSVARLATAIKSTLSNPSYRERAAAIARLIESEDGAGRVAEIVDRVEWTRRE